MSNNSSVGKLVTAHLQLSIDGDHDTQKLFKTKVLFISCEFVNLCHSEAKQWHLAGSVDYKSKSGFLTFLENTSN